MKCIPIILSPRLVAAAICVIDIDEVFEARIASAGAKASKSLKILSFNSVFSVAASTTKSANFTPDSIEVKVLMLFNVSDFFSSDIVHLVSCLSRFFVIVCIALSKAL